MTLREYTQEFMKGIVDYRRSLIKLKEWHPESKAIARMLEKLKDEYMCDENFETIDVDKFLGAEWVRFQMTVSHNLSKTFYGEDYVMRFIEYIDFRDMVENSLMDQPCDQSVYTRIVNHLKIPITDIPRQFIQVISSSDEFMFATNYILKVIHDTLLAPEKHPDVESFRTHVAEHAEKAILALNEKSYYGTYDKEYLTELVMAYRMGFTMIGPLYMTSKIPKNQNKYEDLKAYVDKLWEQFKQNGDSQQGFSV